MPGWTIQRGAIACALTGVFGFVSSGLLHQSCRAAEEVAKPGSVVVTVNQAGQRAGAKMPARASLDAKTIFGSPDAWIDPSSIKVELIFEGDAKSVLARFDTVDPKEDSFFYQQVGGASHNGTVVFQHTSSGKGEARYRISLREWKGKPEDAPASPAPQLGDCDILRYPEGPMSGIFHTKPAIADWDGDGLPDILAGDGIGRICFYRRLGKDPSKYATPQMLYAGDKPLDTLWTSACDVVDWNGDGKLDIISGEEEKGGVLFYENIGTRDKPKLAPGVPITDSKGQPIISPHAPVAEMSFYTKDYSPCPRAVDYNGDGKVDLVLGGYVTGQLFYYENVAKTAHEKPQLEYRGVIKDEAGDPIDVTWSATPEFADLHGDGKLDLVSGHIAERKDQFNWHDAPSVLMWENVGARQKPVWHKSEFPMKAHWAEFLPDVTVPRLVDLDGDGDLDLILGGRCEIYRFENVGDKHHPKFEYREQLKMPNGPFLTNYNMNAIAPAFGDLNGDGKPDMLRGGSGDIPVALMKTFGNAPTFEDAGCLEVDGKKIYTSFVHGDDTSFPFLFDWDGDGKLDLILGDGEGYVRFFRNIGDKQHWKFAPGERFKLENGEDLCAGPPTPKEAKDFEQHSGNRSVPSPADYDGDGKPDLICSNAEGKVYFYHNNGHDRFSPGVEIASGTNRCFSYPVDWNKDGKPDVVLSWATGPVLYLNRGMGSNGAPKFEAQPVKNLPWIPLPRAMAIDWDQDGDDDLLIASSYGLLHFVARNFVDHGYTEAQIVTDTTANE